MAMKLTAATHHSSDQSLNDLDTSSDDPRVTAAQSFATKGFFAHYIARLDEPLTECVRAHWGKGLTAMREGRLKPMELIQVVREA